MVTQQDITKYLNKNVSYLFTISLWNNALYSNGILNPYIINTFLYYNNDNKYINILLKKECIDDLNICIDYKGKDLKYELPAYHNYEEYGNIILLQLYRTPFLKDNELEIIENNHYSLLKDTYLYDKAIAIQKDTWMDLQKRIITEDEVLKGLLEIKFKCKVNHYWTEFNKEKETLTLQKIQDMNTELTINKDWLLSKIALSESLTKQAYEDVLQHATEVLTPHIISLGKQTEIDYEKIYNNVKEALIKKCGKPQYQLPGINGGSPNPLMFGFTDFKGRLEKVIKKYKLTDIDRVTELLCRHVSKLSYPQLQYYITKTDKHDGPISKLAGDYECYVESKPIVTTIDKETLF